MIYHCINLKFSHVYNTCTNLPVMHVHDGSQQLCLTMIGSQCLYVMLAVSDISRSRVVRCSFFHSQDNSMRISGNEIVQNHSRILMSLGESVCMYIVRL